MSGPTQLEFFEVSQTRLPDGRIVLTPIRYSPRRDISMSEASRLLDGMDRQEIADLIEAGEIDAWRKEGRRTKYHIDRDSVMAYRDRRRVRKAG